VEQFETGDPGKAEPALGDPGEFIDVWIQGQLAGCLCVLGVAGLLLWLLRLAH